MPTNICYYVLTCVLCMDVWVRILEMWEVQY